MPAITQPSRLATRGAASSGSFGAAYQILALYDLLDVVTICGLSSLSNYGDLPFNLGMMVTIVVVAVVILRTINFRFAA